jgi:hypothetical protein
MPLPFRARAKEPAMSTRYAKATSLQTCPSDADRPEFSQPEAELMLGLQIASEAVLRLAGDTHAAVARHDAAAAEAARAALAGQLALTTQLIDELLGDDADGRRILH